MNYLKISIAGLIILTSIFLIIYNTIQQENQLQDSYEQEEDKSGWQIWVVSPKIFPIDIYGFLLKNLDGTGIEHYHHCEHIDNFKWSRKDYYYERTINNIPTGIHIEYAALQEGEKYELDVDFSPEELNLLQQKFTEEFYKSTGKKGKYCVFNICILPHGEIRFILADDRERIEMLDFTYTAAKTQNIGGTFNLDAETKGKDFSISTYEKYFERFNYTTKVSFEDAETVCTKNQTEYTNTEIIVYTKETGYNNILKKPSRIKEFRVWWNSNGEDYKSYMYFNQEEVISIFEEAFGDDHNQEGVLHFDIGKENKSVSIYLQVGEKTYIFKEVQMDIVRIVHNAIENDLIYSNYEGNDHQEFIGY